MIIKLYFCNTIIETATSNKLKIKIMTTSQLKNKLAKMNIQFTEVDYNGYNKEICFSLNNMNFAAGFNTKSEIIEDFSRNICYNNSEQEMQRRFFTNFNKLIKYSIL